jgi:sugar lactone lactonase YvrE
MQRAGSGSFFGLLFSGVLGSLCLALISGCGVGPAAAPNPVQLALTGRVHGGQQAVAGAQIQLYAAGAAGNGSASAPLLNSPVISGSDGSFSITSDYSCPSASSQVYLVATQGNPGLGSGGNNPALAMMAPLGSCGNLSPSQFIWINEVTTVAAAWALAPFEADLTHIGASATNAQGLANAFLDAQLIANTSNGTVATLPSNLKTETGKIYGLADAVAACINSDGSASSPCPQLFAAATPTGGSAPANTWDATMNVVKNPGNNVGGVFAVIGSTPPFPTSLTKTPSDWTLSLTVTGGGVYSPTTLAVDSQGDVWVADYQASASLGNGLLSGFNPQGTPLSATGYGASVLHADYGLTIDPQDNIWVTVEDSPSHGDTKGSLVEFSGISSGSALGTPTVFSDSSINYPYAAAADSNGNILIPNYSVPASGSTTNLVVLTPSSSTYTKESTASLIGFPVALAPDTAHGVWITSQDASYASAVHLDSNGNVLFSTDCCGSVDGVSLDTQGNVWLADYNASDANGDPGGAVTQLAPDGTTLQAFVTGGGIYEPSYIAIDAANTVWVTNSHSASSEVKYESFSEVSGANGTVVSPATGFGLDADLLLPYAVAVDPSGNLWISNNFGDSLVMFFGMATPTKTPKTVTPVAP